jgi:hypothetical protein
MEESQVLPLRPEPKIQTTFSALAAPSFTPVPLPPAT